MLSLKPYMDPQVTTFDQPKVQQQMYNGTAAMSVMFSGGMNDLTLEENSKLSDTFEFAAPPKATTMPSTSTTGCGSRAGRSPSTPELDHDMLFVMMASAVSEDASTASVPAAYPAREGMVTSDNSPYGEAANDSIAGAMPPIVSPIIAPIATEITPIIARIISGELSVDEGTAQMQAAGEAVAAADRLDRPRSRDCWVRSRGLRTAAITRK